MERLDRELRKLDMEAIAVPLAYKYLLDYESNSSRVSFQW